MEQVEPIGGFILAVVIIAIFTGLLSSFIAKRMPSSWAYLPIGIISTWLLSVLIGFIYVFFAYTLPHVGLRTFELLVNDFVGMLAFHTETGIEFSILALLVGPIFYCRSFLTARSANKSE